MYPGASKNDEGLEVGFEFFIVCGEAGEVLETREAAVDAVVLPIEGFVVAALLLAVALGGYDGDRSHGLDVVGKLLAVAALVRVVELRRYGGSGRQACSGLV